MWFMFVILVPGRQKQEDQEFKVICVGIATDLSSPSPPPPQATKYTQKRNPEKLAALPVLSFVVRGDSSCPLCFHCKNAELLCFLICVFL